MTFGDRLLLGGKSVGTFLNMRLWLTADGAENAEGKESISLRSLAEEGFLWLL